MKTCVQKIRDPTFAWLFYKHLIKHTALYPPYQMWQHTLSFTHSFHLFIKNKKKMLHDVLLIVFFSHCSSTCRCSPCRKVCSVYMINKITCHFVEVMSCSVCLHILVAAQNESICWIHPVFMSMASSCTCHTVSSELIAGFLRVSSVVFVFVCVRLPHSTAITWPQNPPAIL